MEPSVPSGEPAPSVPETPPRLHSSKGEKLFDALVYGPMNFIGTLVLTVPVAYSMEHGFGHKPFNAIKNGITKYTEISPGIAQKVLSTTTLMMGGNLMLGPVRYAEAHKKEVIGKFNHMLGDKSDNANMVVGPPLDWMSLIKSRGLAWLTVFGSFVTLGKVLGDERMKRYENKVGESVAKFFKTDAAKEVLRDGKKISVPSRVFEYGKLAAFDIYATAMAVALLYVGSRFFARKHEEKIERREMAQHTDAVNDNITIPNDNGPLMDKPKTTVAGTRAQGMLALANEPARTPGN